MSVTRQHVEIDDQLLARAQAILGENSVSGTVDVALKRMTNDELIMRHIERLRSGYYEFDLEALEEARDPRRRIPGGRPPEDDNDDDA